MHFIPEITGHVFRNDRYNTTQNTMSACTKNNYIYLAIRIATPRKSLPDFLLGALACKKKTIFANCVAYVRTFGYCARREILEWATTGRARVRTTDTQETDVYYAVAAQRVCHESRA